MSATRACLRLRSVEEYLGDPAGRFFGDGHRRAVHDVRRLAFGSPDEGTLTAAGGVSVAYPTDWSTKKGRTGDLRPHLSTVDTLVLGVQFAEAVLARWHHTDPSGRAASWLRKVTIRAGHAPEEDLDVLPVHVIARRPEPEPDDTTAVSVVESGIGLMSVRCEVVHPVHPTIATTPSPSGVVAVPELLGDPATRHYGTGFTRRTQEIRDVVVEPAALSARALVSVHDGGPPARRGIEGTFRPAPSMVDGFVTIMQLAQILLYEIDDLDRDRSSTLWMQRVVLSASGPPASPPLATTATAAFTRSDVVEVGGSPWRNVAVRADHADMDMRSVLTHRLPRDTPVGAVQ